MHTVNILWCVLLVLIELTKALNYSDFGLPNNNPCIFTFDQTVYIINEQSLSIRFNNEAWNMITPQIIKHNLTTVASCRITNSGKLILIPLSEPLQVIEDIKEESWNINNNISYSGSQNAIDIFITKTTFISHFTTTTFNDFIMIFGGNQSSTFILDTRYSTIYIWYEIPLQPTTPPSSPDSVLYATSRWVLHFRIEINIVYIDLFDSITFQWYGTISSIELLSLLNINQRNIQVIPLINNSTDWDSLLIIAVQQHENNKTTTELWKLDISTWIPDSLTLIKLNPLIQQSNTFSGGGSVIVTPIDDEIAFFYGGFEQMTFLNTRNFSFVSPPQWLITQDPTTITSINEENNNHTLPIVLGSVFGSIFFIIILLLLFIWFYKRKRNNVPLRPNNNNNSEKPSMLQKNKWPLLGKTRAKNEESNSRLFRESPPLSEFTLSPIKRLSPIKMFSIPDAASSSSAAVQEIVVLPQEPEEQQEQEQEQQQQQQQQKMLKKSRFREHFDFHSYPPTQHPDTIVPSHSLPLNTSTKTIQPQQQIPRSSSSYV